MSDGVLFVEIGFDKLRDEFDYQWDDYRFSKLRGICDEEFIIEDSIGRYIPFRVDQINELIDALVDLNSIYTREVVNES